MSSSPPRPYDAQADAIEAGRKMKDPTSTLFKFYTFVYAFSSYCWLLSFSVLLFLPWIPLLPKTALGTLLTFLGIKATRLMRSRLKQTRDAQRGWEGRRRRGGEDEEQSLMMGGAELGSKKKDDEEEEEESSGLTKKGTGGLGTV